MKFLRYSAFLAIVVLILASCSSNPAPAAPSVQAPELLDNGILRPEMKTFAGGSDVIESQAETYRVSLRFVGNPPASVRNALTAAKARWEGVITRGVPVTNISIPAGDCGSNPAFSGNVDDILIFAGVANIDGPGNILAQAGPCFIRLPSGFPIAGVLIFDSADVAGFSSLLTPIAIHEIGHSLGIGTIWDFKGLLLGAGTSNPSFTGVNARREWRTLGGTGNVPVENTGGPGTRDSHWREATFDNELMTGFLNNGTNPLSRVTIGSLRDLGYFVNYSVADPYQLPN